VQSNRGEPAGLVSPKIKPDTAIILVRLGGRRVAMYNDTLELTGVVKKRFADP
jgi:hypothetical protein